jgi:FkbM family methyltransferase
LVVASSEIETQDVATRNGRMLVPDPGHDIIARFLAEQGEWAELELEFIRQFLPDNGRLADIGAFVGTFGLGVQRLASVGGICFVEANPEIFPLLDENVRRNCKAQAVALNALVAPSGFHGGGSRDAHNFGSASFVAGENNASRVGVSLPRSQLTLAELDRAHGPFDLIKLDVEGMEAAILGGERALLSRPAATFWIECNESERSLETVDVLLSQERPVYYFAYPSFNPDNFARAKKPIFPFAFEAGLVVTSQTPVLPDELARKDCFLRRITSRDDLAAAMRHTPRWAPPEWWGRPVSQIVALAVHDIERQDASLREHRTALDKAEALLAKTSEDYERALKEAAALVAERDQSIRAYAAGLARAEEIVREREQSLSEYNAMLSHAQSRLEDTRKFMITQEEQIRAVERALQRADLLAAERLAAIDDEKTRREAAERAAADQLALLNAERMMRATAEDRIAVAEHAVQRADLLSAQRYAAFEAEQRVRTEVERLAADRLTLLEAERSFRVEAEARLNAITRSILWRISAPLRFIVSGIARLFR